MTMVVIYYFERLATKLARTLGETQPPPTGDVAIHSAACMCCPSELTTKSSVKESNDVNMNPLRALPNAPKRQRVRIFLGLRGGGSKHLHVEATMQKWQQSTTVLGEYRKFI